jgi:hypothetical protein
MREIRHEGRIVDCEALSTQPTGTKEHRHHRIAALTAPGHARSIQILTKLGLRYERTVTPPARETQLFAWEAERQK